MANTIREARKYTNIPGMVKEGFELVGDQGFSEPALFEGGGSYSSPEIVPSQAPRATTLAENSLRVWQQRESFKQTVYNQIGGNPSDITSEKALGDFRNSGGYKDLFDHVFRGQLTWRDRGRMDNRQKAVWNSSVAAHRANIVSDTKELKSQQTSRYKELIGEYDKQVKAEDTRVRNVNKEARLAAKKEQQAKTKALETEQKKRRVKAEKKAEDAATITLKEKKAYQTQMKDYDPVNNVFSKFDKTFVNEDGTKGAWENMPKTALDIDILNETARAAGHGILVPIVRQRIELGEEHWYGDEPDEEFESDEFFQLPVMEDSNILGIMASTQQIREISKDDHEAGKALEEAFKGELQRGLTEQGMKELVRRMKGGAAPEASSLLTEEFRAVQESGDSSMKEEFQKKINTLPEAERMEFLSKLKKKEPEPRGSIKVVEDKPTTSQTPETTGTTAENLQVNQTTKEKRADKRGQRQAQRRVRRRKTQQIAQQ